MDGCKLLPILSMIPSHVTCSVLVLPRGIGMPITVGRPNLGLAYLKVLFVLQAMLVPLQLLDCLHNSCLPMLSYHGFPTTQCAIFACSESQSISHSSASRRLCSRSARKLSPRPDLTDAIHRPLMDDGQPLLQHSDVSGSQVCNALPLLVCPSLREKRSMRELISTTGTPIWLGISSIGLQ